ncbi:hypothetical protein [Corynebacterium halotolerans]|uniref:Or membrane protein n=1 Tax=Corynebacterium halotolerans YIM 70093 = DSM 44683 TaxID=1121362 RepID=M1MX55_9CORY|nr:hypothetical protein [Corynebacterium halotolerans]AGF72344.1 hypothetical protein A605_06710 [Corynebacterium halotolerans YIM 70093 = DSM 44683]
MRRAIIALATSAALVFGAVPAAQAESGSSFSQSIEELPADLRLGSSGAELLSSTGATGDDQREGSSMMFRDWLIGFVALGIFGALANVVTSVAR